MNPIYDGIIKLLELLGRIRKKPARTQKSKEVAERYERALRGGK